jgi:hypothetical protein
MVLEKISQIAKQSLAHSGARIEGRQRNFYAFQL